MYDNEYLKFTLEKAFSDSDYYYVPKGITRYDYVRTHAWWVRLIRDDAPFKARFYDAHYESIDDSLRAAILYRHEILSSFPLQKKNRRNQQKLLSSDPNKRISRQIEKGVRQPYICWIARWYDENYKVRTKRFSVLKFGEDGAKNEALMHTIKHQNPKPKPLMDSAKIDPYLKQSFKKMSREDVQIFSTINSGPYNSKSAAIEDSNPFGYEGERKIKLHQSIERDRKLRNAKISEFINENGSIFCEICLLRFTDIYPFLKKDIIEVHHIVPLAKLEKETETRLNDLMLLCSNCHLAIHQGDAETNLLLALEHFSKLNTNKH